MSNTTHIRNCHCSSHLCSACHHFTNNMKYVPTAEHSLATHTYMRLIMHLQVKTLDSIQCQCQSAAVSVETGAQYIIINNK